MRVSLIICTRNRCEALRSALASLANIQVPTGSEVEVVVADNGSTDATPSAISATKAGNFAAKHLFVPEGGKAVALNTAVRHASGDVLVMTDDDVIPAPGWLCAITRPITDGTADAVAGAITIAPHLRRPWMTPLHRSWLAAEDRLLPSPETLVGANMAVARHVFEKVPGFDPELGPGRLGLWEDTLFGLQLREAGFRLAAAPSAKVEHHFLADRLLRGAFLSRATAEARSSAYVDWHWRHLGALLSPSELWRLNLLLWAKRIVRWSDWHQPEGAPEWELNLVAGIRHAHSLRRERQRPKNYSRHGLVRLTNART